MKPGDVTIWKIDDEDLERADTEFRVQLVKTKETAEAAE
jgi:hypothetical protein